ncbi:glycosyltransferase family 2 protein [Rhodococcus triatomae]|uniref:Galactofuranosylgalactofuranosylrhamnosyl-N-acetylglucosaminyl-diphospho-decaprenol beta-1,5/1,6-galactofuranosyltransferase n=1 Tax=Rhodococcus triatomae TaxID=300028 RepID=A0A1G8I3G0_9NOCA|nr:glycosyltransferase [Rhodococcus triatomae]QNG20942.1 glycosyltransferase family 2 protein [Rhodococcus triatomae]QNG23143.1 glycosyltransferase family 2 protein [Rhodococcus triatomae]SDI13403.1 galactofuranosylgalactofuranosylrhamnosyl-N-acetylglucosaminyl-diphospho-decaprenol beta-1,5/1,6-galactofuranosyltransferase [Rhodococcus triatomae]
MWVDGVSVPGQTDTQVAERARAGRLLAQRGLFAGTSPIVDDGLYAVADGPSGRTRTRLHLEDGTRAHTNTYFGRFAASYWQRWTTVTSVRAGARVEAASQCTVRLMASDIAGHRRIIGTVQVEGASDVRLDAALDKFLDGGALWLEFDALGGPVEVGAVEWTVDFDRQLRPVAVAICTFNRADDCAETVAALASDEVVLDALDGLYVVDQGTDLVQDRARFQEVAPRFGERLHYLRQPNLGGAGGFTRGLFEVSAEGKNADVILMDDDILCEPETVLRLSAFANVTTEPTLVGAQMLFLYNPDYLNVGAEEVHLDTLQHGQRVPKALRNTSMLENNQERRVDAGYNAWWTCLIPGEVVAEIGLPLPIFFQWDDVEYGIRARRAGYVTVTLPNAAVWHADFYWKDFDDWARYFSTRNSLIVGALHGDVTTKQIRRQFLGQLTEYIVAMQYGLAATTLRGIEDFLAGPEVLRDGGIEAMAAIRKERSAYPETVRYPAAEAPVRDADISVQRDVGEPSRMGVVRLKRAVNQFLGRTRGGLVAVPREDAHWWHVSLFDHVVVTDASQSGVRIRRRDKDTATALMKRTFELLRRLDKEGADVQERYRRTAAELISRENWERLFGR